MSVARCREINARLRAAGVTVHEWSGWESRGNGQSSAYEGGIVHHTGTPYGYAFQSLVTGRTDLAGPLCNYTTNEDGSMTVIAAHPANHAGASGGRSMGPLRTTTLFNKYVLGNEIVYPGTSPMRDAQYRTALLWSRIVTDVCGFGDIQRARAHAETSITGKWDPGDAPSRTINMTAFRTAAALIGAPAPVPEDDMNFEQDRRQHNLDRWLTAILDDSDTVTDIQPYWDGWGTNVGTPPARVSIPNPFTARLRRLETKVNAGFAGLSDDEANVIAAIRAMPTTQDVDESAIAALLAPALAPLIQSGATPAQVEDAVRRVFARAGQGGTQ